MKKVGGGGVLAWKSRVGDRDAVPSSVSVPFHVPGWFRVAEKKWPKIVGGRVESRAFVLRRSFPNSRLLLIPRA